MNKPLKCSVGITAYNEEKNISRILSALRKQKLVHVEIDEILIISSGSTDNTEAIVKEFMRKDSRVKLVTESKRNGKASAVNLFIEYAKNDILVLESADTLPDRNTIELLVRPFTDKNMGITGSHPIPVNSKKTFVGYAVNMQWELHHKISLKHPKIGETVAFRKSFKKIPVFSAVDEVNIDALIKGQGYKTKYIPQAIVRNKGPETLPDFIKQRRRIYAGHLATKQEYNYVVSTISARRILFALIQDLFERNKANPIALAKESVYVAFTIYIEAYCRFLGFLDFRIYKKDHSIWEISETTKSLTDNPRKKILQPIPHIQTVE